MAFPKSEYRETLIDRGTTGAEVEAATEISVNTPMAGEVELFGLVRKSFFAFALGTAAFASNALAVTFDFRAADTNVASAFYNEGGIDLTVTAVKNFGTTNDAAVVSRAIGGMGVVGAPTAANLGVNEALTFTFSPAVSLLSAITFERGPQAETFRLFDSNDVAVLDFTTPAIGGASTVLFDFASYNIVGTYFSIMGLEDGNWNRGGRIAQIEVAAVPLPASFLLLLSGMGALASVSLMRRRRSA